VDIRSAVDYGLARRAALVDLAAGRTSRLEACDADPYLLRAARYHGEDLPYRCPVCRHGRLRSVAYAFGDALKEASGRACRARQLESLARRYPEVTVYLVEVCPDCGWNHLLRTFVIGAGAAAAAATGTERD
jgi:Family of unknown function (DUF5318)